MLRQATFLRSICAGIPGEMRPFQSGTQTYHGVLAKRPVILQYRYGGSLRKNPQLEIRFPLTQKFWLRLLPEGPRQTPAPEIEIGEDSFDKLFLVHSDQLFAAKQFLKSEQVIDQLFLFFPFDRLEFHRGEARLLILKPREKGLRSLQTTLQAFSRIIDIYEAQQMALKISIAESSQSRCAFCREEIDNKRDILFECKRCGAVLHRACRDENGQCTTWGCR